MIQEASKYGNVRQAAKVQTSGVPAAPARMPAKTPFLKPIRTDRPTARMPDVFIPRLLNPASMFEDWYFKELREGGMLAEYIRREKATTHRRIRRVARQTQHVKPNFKSDVQLKAVVPAREFMRWRHTDRDFWADDSNLKRLKRDNPEMRIFI